MNDKFYLQPNFWNFITVNLMAIIGFTILAMIASALGGSHDVGNADA